MRLVDYMDGAVTRLLFLLATVAWVCNAASTTLPPTPSVCVAFVIANQGRVSVLADPIDTAKDEATCENMCRTDQTCLSYQINSNNDTTLCWIQRNADAFTDENLFDQSNVVEYVKMTCSSVCFNILNPSSVSAGAIERTDLKDIAACESACRAEPTCKSYQINMNSGLTLCWLQTGANPFMDSNFYEQPNVVEWVKTSCTIASSSTTLPLSSSSISSTTQTSTTSFPTSSASLPCVTFDIKFPGRVSGDANERTDLKDNTTCESACRADPTCKSFQINMNPGQTFCWLQTGANPFTESNFYAQSNVVELVKASCNSVPSTTQSSTTLPLSSSSVPSATQTSTTSFPISSTSLPRSSTSFPISSTTSACVTFNIKFPGRVSGEATERTDLKDNATCESACRADSSCKSYQINMNSGQTLCWIQTLANPFTDSNFYAQSNVVELVKENCTSGSSSTSFPTSSTSTSISSTSFPVVTTSNPCIAFDILNPGMQSIGAVEMPNLTNNSSCEAACRADTACVSYQINKNQGQTYCWIQRSAKALDPSNLYSQSGVEEYVKTTSCSSASSSVPTVTSSTGSSTITRIPTTFTTFPSSTSVTGSTVSTTTRTTRPPTQSTARMCSYNFVATYNMNMRGGTETRWVTLDECQQACVANLQCIAIDVNENAGQIYCYLIFNRVPLTSYPGVAHYDISRGSDCPTLSSTSSTSATTTPGTSTCVYKKLEGANADGGNPVGSNILESQCLQLCNLNPACLSFEYALGSKTCFIHTTNDVSQNNLCCNRYVLQCSTTRCTDDFLLQSGYSPSTLQGYPQSDVTTLDQCKLRCLNDASCTRFFYFPQNPRSQTYCYLYYTATDSVIPTQGIDLYIRQRCLYNVSITVATTTTTPVPTLAPGSCVIELVFVVDSSGSIREDSSPNVDNWQLMKLFIKSLINSSIHYGVNTDHVGIVQFSEFPRVVFDLQLSFNTPQSGLIQAIDDNMPYIGAETNTGEGLRLGREMLANSSRPNARRILVLLTDGYVTSRWKDGFWTEVLKLNQSDIIRYAIGVSNNVSLPELYAVAIDKNAVDLADSYADLPSAVDKASLFINSFSCQPNVKPTTALTSTSSSTTKPTTSSSSSTTTTSIRTSLSTATSTTTSSTSTATSTTTSSTSTSPTTAPVRNRGGEGLFGAYKTSNATGTSTTNFTGVLANRFNLFNIASDQFLPAISANEYYYTEICAGIQQSTTCLLRTTGAFPPLSFDWLSNAQNDIDSGCRGGVLAVATGSSTSLSQMQTAGGLYSNEQLLTSWSMFSITDTMKYNSSLLSVYSSNAPSAPGQFPFDSPYVNPTSPWALYNAANTRYTCTPRVTAYFFSMSVGIAAGQTASVVLSVDDVAYEMVRLGSTTTGTTTLARSVLAPCSDNAIMTLSSGAVVPGDRLISFTAFPYQRSDGLNSVSWTAFRTSNFTASNPLTFDSWIAEPANIQTSNTVTIPRTGYYYVYISTGIHAQSTANLNLLRNNQILFGLRRRATNYNGVDTIGHGLVVLLNQTDVLQVQSLESGYSSATGKHATFFGMLLYDS